MFALRMAGFDFKIDNRFDYIKNLCNDYIISDENIKKDNFKGIIKVSDNEISYENKDGGNWNDDYLEALAIYRKITEILLKDDVILFHGSCVKLDDRGYLFTGKSGSGKSTHRMLWQKFFGDKLTVVNDDKPLFKIDDNSVIVYGTPFGGKENLQKNTSAELKGIVFIRQAKENSIRRLSAEESFPQLLNQTYRQNGTAEMIKTLDMVSKINKIPVFELKCTISEEAVQICYKALEKGDI